METLWQDVKYGVRMLVKSPGFTLAAVGILAVGIGANTAIFTLVNEALLRPRPGIGNPDRLVDVGRNQGDFGFDNMSYPNYRDYRDRNRTLAGLAGYALEPYAVSLSEGDSAERVHAAVVSGNYFSVLEVQPAAGRFFTQEEDQTVGAHPVTVLSHSFWQRRFQGDPGIVGRDLHINGQPVRVVGVAAAEFRGSSPLAPDAWFPMHMYPVVRPGSNPLEQRRSVFMVAVGRLKPGVSLAQARADLRAIASDLERAFPEANRGRGVAVTTSGLIPGDLRLIIVGFFTVLMGFVGLVLLIACFDVTGMLLVRAQQRRREVAVRVAMGASRWRIARQMLSEGLLLFALGGVAGLLLAVWMRDALLAFVPQLPVPLHVELSLDWRVLGFGLLLSLVSGLLASLAPALQTSHTDPVAVLKEETSGARRRLRLRNALVLGQVAVTLILLVCAGLFVRALERVAIVDPGMDLRNLHVVELDFSLAGMQSADGLAFADQLLQRVQQLPGVRSASLSWGVPLDGNGRALGGITAPGSQGQEPDRSGMETDWNIVTPGYFANMGVPLLRGREFTAADAQGAPAVAIINETLAQRLWPGEDPIGKRIENPQGDEGVRVMEVVGLARNQKYRSFGDGPRNFVFVPLRQNYFGALFLAVRSEPGAPPAPGIRTLLHEMNPHLPILHAQSMEEYAGVGLLPQRLAGWVAGSLGLLGLLLAGTGLYGVTAFSSAQRTREIGIRMALGAQRGDVLKLVLRQGLQLAAIGLAIGMAMALAAAQLIAGLLIGVSPADPLVLLAVAVGLAAVALLASYLPARRATQIDPLVALRYE
jgi:predicted permease